MMHAARPHEYFEDAFLAWLDRECGGYGSLRAGGDDVVIVQSQAGRILNYLARMPRCATIYQFWSIWRPLYPDM
jgi:hypothetical protein